MHKNLLFIALIIVAGVGTASAFAPKTSQSSPVKLTRDTTEVASQSEQPPEPNLSQEKDGITVTIEKLDQKDDQTILTVSLSNHQYDLGKNEIFEQATLNGVPSESFTLPSNAAGGHHVEAEIVFAKTETGSFEITPIEGTTFTFTDLW